MGYKGNLIDYEQMELYSNEEKSLYELTDRQCAILLSMTEYLGWTTRWYNLPVDTDLYALKSDIDLRLMQPMSTVDDICEGVVCGILEVASILTAGGALDNITYDVLIDKDTKEVQTEPKSDPSSSTTQQLRAGGAIETATKSNKIILNMEDWYQSYASSLSSWETLVNATYQTDESAVLGMITDYKAYRDAPNPAPSQITISELSDWMFCSGATKQQLKNYLIDSYDPASLIAVLDMIVPLLDTNWDEWDKAGEKKPSDAYLTYECYIRPPAELLTTTDDLQQNTLVTFAVDETAFTFASARNFRVTVEGTYTDGNGNYVDILYELLSGQNPVPRNAFFAFRFNNGVGAVDLKPLSLPLFNTSGQYSWLVSVPAGNAYQEVGIAYNYSEAWISGAQGNITVLVQDVGAS